MQPSSQWRHIFNKGKQFENQLFIHKPKCKQNIYFGLYRGPEGVFNDQTGPILLSSYTLIDIYGPCQIRKQSDKKFLSLNPKYDKNILKFFSYLGGPGGALMSNPGERKFQGSKSSSQSRQMYNKGEKTASFSYMGHNIQKCAFLAIQGGGGGAWVAQKYSNWAHFASQLSSHLYQSTYKIWKQSDKDFLSYRENDEMSADAAADAVADAGARRNDDWEHKF